MSEKKKIILENEKERVKRFHSQINIKTDFKDESIDESNTSIAVYLDNYGKDNKIDKNNETLENIFDLPSVKNLNEKVLSTGEESPRFGLSTNVLVSKLNSDENEENLPRFGRKNKLEIYSKDSNNKEVENNKNLRKCHSVERVKNKEKSNNFNKDNYKQKENKVKNKNNQEINNKNEGKNNNNKKIIEEKKKFIEEESLKIKNNYNSKNNRKNFEIERDLILNNLQNSLFLLEEGKFNSEVLKEVEKISKKKINKTEEDEGKSNNNILLNPERARNWLESKTAEKHLDWDFLTNPSRNYYSIDESCEKLKEKNLLLSKLSFEENEDKKSVKKAARISYKNNWKDKIDRKNKNKEGTFSFLNSLFSCFKK